MKYLQYLFLFTIISIKAFYSIGLKLTSNLDQIQLQTCKLMEKDFNTPRKNIQNEELLRSLMSAASGKKAKNSNLKGNAFGDRSASYRKHNYQPMISVMPLPLTQQKETPPDDESVRLKYQISQVEQAMALRLRQEAQREQLKSVLLQRLMQQQAQLRATRKLRLEKGNELIEASKGTNKIREWVLSVEEARRSVLQQRSSILQQSDDKLYKINRLIFKGQRLVKKRFEEVKALAVREAAVHEQWLKQRAVNEELLEELNAIDEKNSNVERQLEEEERIQNELKLEISILKMQLNPYLRISFECAFWDGASETKSMILNKDPNIWEQKKTKALPREDIKNYVVMQLYPNWKRIVNNVSFNFSGFKMIFFQQGKIQDLRLITGSGQNTPASNSQKDVKSKSRNLILFYSTCTSSYQDLKSLYMELAGQGNEVLKIAKISFSKAEGEDLEDMSVNYSFREEERCKMFRIIRIKELTRENIAPFLTKEEDKTLLIKIEVPLSFSQLAEKSKAEEVFKMLERYM